MQIRKLVRAIDTIHVNQEIKVSGRFSKHYAPKAKIILDQKPLPGQGFIALSRFVTPKGSIRIASPKSNKEFAQTLYAALRKCDTLGLTILVIKQPKGTGISIAIRDRLKKAANSD
jgi:L-threonylcarbamoyladenylate synthase